MQDAQVKKSLTTLLPRFYPINLQHSRYKHVCTSKGEKQKPSDLDLQSFKKRINLIYRSIDLQSFKKRINLGPAGPG